MEVLTKQNEELTARLELSFALSPVLSDLSAEIVQKWREKAGERVEAREDYSDKDDGAYKSICDNLTRHRSQIKEWQESLSRVQFLLVETKGNGADGGGGDIGNAPPISV